MSAPDLDPAFETLLDYLKRSRGLDLTGYKRPSLVRRIGQQMRTAGIGNYADYTSVLEADPDETRRLLNTILINVTGFFRDPPAWEYLRKEVVPQILAGKLPAGPVRVWSAGCASGQEPYTLAIVLAEALGVGPLRERVRIHATDRDEEALAYARQGAYTEKEVAGVPPELRGKYFEQVSGRYVLSKDLRSAVIFGRHDLTQDVPISRLDLLVCRNTLIYLNTEAQAGILGRFHFALNDGGFLFLGKAEMLVGRSGLFAPVDLRHHIFARAPGGNGRGRPFFFIPSQQEEAAAPASDAGLTPGLAFEASPLPQVVVSAEGFLALASERARLLFRLNARDLGRPFRDLELSYRPVELRSPIEKVCADGHPIVLKDVHWNREGLGASVYDVQITPLSRAAARPLGACITFLDVTDYKRLQRELEVSNREIAVALEESQSTAEELETMNEELQSSAEELETMNEELQSTNEELETMNEELQSMNEEMHTTNEELRRRSAELTRVTEFLESVLGSLPGGVAVVGPDLQVQVWDHKAEALWGLRGDEAVGRDLMGLDIGLPVERVDPLLRACLAGSSPPEEVTLDATNRRGKTVVCKVTCTPVMGRAGGVRGVMLLMTQVG